MGGLVYKPVATQRFAKATVMGQKVRCGKAVATQRFARTVEVPWMAKRAKPAVFKVFGDSTVKPPSRSTYLIKQTKLSGEKITFLVV